MEGSGGGPPEGSGSRDATLQLLPGGALPDGGALDGEAFYQEAEPPESEERRRRWMRLETENRKLKVAAIGMMAQLRELGPRLEHQQSGT